MNSTEKKEIVFHSADTFFDRFFDEIEKAQETIDMETYIFHEDPTGRKIIDGLKEAAKRGVKVRLCVDGVGSRLWLNHNKLLGREKNIDLKVYHPLPFFFAGFTIYNPLRLTRTLALLSKMNKRNHKKLFIIDEKMAFSGSINCWQESYNRRETGILIYHSLDAMRASFLYTWKKSKYLLKKSIKKREDEKKLKKTQNEAVKTRHNLYTRYKSYQTIYDKLDNSKKKVWLTTPYFAPPWKFIQKLGQLAEKGLEVKLILPYQLDWPFVKFISRFYYRYLLQKGVIIREYKPRILHAKVYFFDDSCLVGTTNLDYRSFFHDLQLDVLMQTKDALNSLEEQFQKDYEESVEISLEEINRQGFFEKILAYFVLLLKNWV